MIELTEKFRDLAKGFIQSIILFILELSQGCLMKSDDLSLLDSISAIEVNRKIIINYD